MIKRLGVHGLIKNDKGLYLVAKRSETDVEEANCWDLIGGGIDERETIDEGFKREVKEEVGIDVGRVKLIQAYTIDTPGLALIVAAKALSGLVVLSLEHNDYRWISFEELKTISPVSLHLKAVQFMMKNNVDLVKYEEYPLAQIQKDFF